MLGPEQVTSSIHNWQLLWPHWQLPSTYWTTEHKAHVIFKVVDNVIEIMNDVKIKTTKIYVFLKCAYRFCVKIWQVFEQFCD